MSSFSSLPYSNLNNKNYFIMGLFLSRNLTCNFLYPFLFSKKLSVDLFPKQLENMMCLVSPRTGRHLQRYDKGCRQVVGCIPYRYKSKGIQDKEIEVLVISAQKGQGMQFPKGGWEIDESMEQAALRETIEEAGVVGNVESKLGKWVYKSKSQAIMHEGYMFPLLVNKQLDNWPEMNFRKRRWMTVAEAKEICPHAWMKEALDVLVCRQTQPQPKL
ncbi:PREDICTED: nudix hydrolase 18, mitochondrial-like [Lupinus angustifolius]|uniref:nudix hydrolase 18, mitochondrial-like n=1 Tax=Lupinus angustifolius TaxID=3871 RepID=UPI00092FB078|nr:PREDICTED: nudix hydrolase 18, mitochondrial-like [Lupinus angustifolius]